MEVTLHEGAPVAPAADSVTDRTGRVIALKKPPILQQYNIILAVGPEVARNDTYMQLVTPLLWVSAIDGDPVATPKTKAMLDALIQRLDEHGVEAVMAWFMERMNAPVDAVGEAAKN